MKRRTERAAASKRPYRTPSLKVHGDFRKLTASKGGTNNDGTGKPRTKQSNPNQ